MDKAIREYVIEYAEVQDKKLTEDKLTEIVDAIFCNDQIWDEIDATIYNLLPRE